MGVPCTATITVKNSGTANAGAFMLRWYGLSTFANASCAWAFPGLAAGASKTESCNFTFASWYPVNKTSIVYVDHSSQVSESNEGNNTATISPFGVIP
jgi:subtilase family serine protease